MQLIKFLFLTVLFTHFSAWAQTDTDVIDAADLKSTDSTSIQVEEKDVVDVKTDSFNKAEEAEPKNNTGRIEKIEVTGSYVRRIDVEGPSPVVTINKEDFEKAGVDTVSDYLRENPMFTNSQDSGDRDGYFRFRGQHAGSTLILINGMRVPKLGGPGRGFYSGVESIPTNVIERVEVLKDGSSALYGSDAMAGVMNFITKKDYDGAEYSTRINVPEINKGIQQNHTMAFGKSYSRGNWFASAQYVEQRGYTQKDAGNYFTEPTVRPSSKGSITTFKNGNFENNSRFEQQCNQGDEDCQADYRAIDFVREPRENIGTMLSGRVDLTSDISFQAVGMYNRRKRMDLGRPGFINISAREGDARINVSDLGSNSLKNSLNGDTLELSVQPVDEVGPQRIAVLQDAYSAQTKLEGYFLETWKWDLSNSYAYSIEERDHQNGLVSKSGVRQALADGWNPMSVGPQNTGALDGARVQGVEAYEASLATARLLATGELFEMRDLYGTGGPASIALGVEGQWETTNDAHDEILINQPLNQPYLPNQAGSRSVTSMFGEFVVYPLDSLELQAAGRYDGYSDFGGTFNPKFSMGWRPSNKVLFRSSWGTNFNAPSVRNLIERDSVSYEDIEFCDRNNPDCNEQTLGITRYRADDLRPETGVNYNFGTVIQPNKKWTFTIDQWNFEGRDTFSKVSDSAYNSVYNSVLGQNNGDIAATDATMSDLGVNIERDANGEVTNVSVPSVTNMGDRTIRGLDLNIAFGSPVRILGRVLKASVKMDHTHMLVYKTKTAPQLNYFYREDLEWKNTLSFGLRTQDHGYRLAARTLAGDTGNNTQIRTHTEYDFNYDYDIPWWDGRLALGVKNLLNTRPPVDRGSSLVRFDRGFNTYAFQALGRRYYVGYSHTF